MKMSLMPTRKKLESINDQKRYKTTNCFSTGTFILPGSKKKQKTKKENTRKKIIFGAEVAKVLGCDIGYVDKELVFGVLLNISKLSEHDIESFRAQGQIYIENVINKSKC
ncbi:conjugal transfer protein TraD [Mangrovibacter sp. MFB070]|uniref:conjugal transfer protein TraD n=1 Tax=Mangrovibacter sp. MFB070 TaxID=1224318 RepID=UPI001F31EECB|nr:conjugal transfer protein TraD [Mangrovibacter sp. MFB070]